ncbi:hypothetical protein [Saccharopolyspora elongata]|uniref:Uncharacterized protein n=1 Tax=Saccharopolyspora elongata TaxID=2530387 RepID=A0A4V2YJ74_9PSEU|nr:hypothetical protein [Saccharopolyspora elongata]TDD37787.1 hypothetical protein E1288_39990 [Saccharopolyspora elongata]
MSGAGAQLIAFLEHMADLYERQSPPSSGTWRFRSFPELLLAEGRLWESSVPYAKSVRWGHRRCWQNASQLADADADLVYAEGLALITVGSLGTEHAWCVRNDAGVVDVTWPAGDGAAYVGLPMIDTWRRKAQAESGHWSLLVSHTKVGQSLLRDGPDPSTLVDIGHPVADIRSRLVQ